MRSSILVFNAAILCADFALTAEIGPGDDIELAVAGLQPGDELVLRGGVYSFNENITLTATGTSSFPILIRAKPGEQARLQQQTANNNVIEVNASAHVVLKNLQITGGSQGIRLINSDFITIEDCEVWETGDVAISANSGGTYEGLKILRNHIHHTNGTGEGMYLGCNNDACRVANSLIEGNYVHHTNRSTVAQGDGIEIKEGSYGNIIRDNVIHDTKFPGILLYSTVGNGPPNIVESNVVWNVGDNTIQVAADARIYNNIILGNVAFQPHQAGQPSNIEFVHNTVINSGAGMQVRGVSGPILIANNAIYSQTVAISLISGDLVQVEMVGNVGSGGVFGASEGYSDGQGITVDFVAGNFSGEPPINLFPAIAGSLVGAGDNAHVTVRDFNGGVRQGVADSGAYIFDSNGNPGWTIVAGFKPVAGANSVPQPLSDLQTN